MAENKKQNVSDVKGQEEQKQYQLTIRADSVTSTDERFRMDNLSLGDNYKPLDAYYISADGETITKRHFFKGEKRISNQTILRLACQIFEKEISGLSVEEKENFPVCKYSPDHEMISGIFSSVADFRKYKNSIERCIYFYDNGRQFVIYCWNIFSPIIFVQECLKRWEKDGQFVLTYRDKTENEFKAKKDEVVQEELGQEELVQQFKGYKNPYSSNFLVFINIYLY